jgi:hypothetical protein
VGIKRSLGTGRAWRVAGVFLAAGYVGSCVNTPPVLARLMEARRVAANLRTSFIKANEAANRAVLTPNDEESRAAAAEAAKATEAVVQATGSLDPLLKSLGYETEVESLARFQTQFEEFRRIDDEVLPLAVENTNVKAQRLSFGAGQEAADGFAAGLRRASASKPSAFTTEAETARADVLEIQVLQARHIAEADETAMGGFEARMQQLAADAQQRLSKLRGEGDSAADVDSAATSLKRFLDVNQEIVALSRKNTNVRSLALTLGRKRVVAAECEDALRVLEEALARHGSQATR